MAHRHCSFLSLARGCGGAALPLVAFALLAGCATPPDETRQTALGAGPTNTGTFPNLNIRQQAAAPQLSDEETAAKLASLRRVQQQQAGGAVPAETPEQRRRRLKLLQDEQADTLRAIEEN